MVWVPAEYRCVTVGVTVDVTPSPKFQEIPVALTDWFVNATDSPDTVYENLAAGMLDVGVLLISLCTMRPAR
jgi:hypothetical protein